MLLFLYFVCLYFLQTLSYNPQAYFEPKGVCNNAKLMPVPFRKGVPQYESGRQAAQNNQYYWLVEITIDSESSKNDKA